MRTDVRLHEQLCCHGANMLTRTSAGRRWGGQGLGFRLRGRQGTTTHRQRRARGARRAHSCPLPHPRRARRKRSQTTCRPCSRCRSMPAASCPCRPEGCCAHDSILSGLMLAHDAVLHVRFVVPVCREHINTAERAFNASQRRMKLDFSWIMPQPCFATTQDGNACDPLAQLGQASRLVALQHTKGARKVRT